MTELTEAATEPERVAWLRELHALCDAATPGSWEADGNRVRGYARQVVAGDCPKFADAAFIARARTALPVALSHIESLMNQLANARQRAQGLTEQLYPDRHGAQLTHSAECWRWHHECAVARIEALEKAVGEWNEQVQHLLRTAGYSRIYVPLTADKEEPRD